MQSIRFKTEGPILNDKILKIPDLRRKNLNILYKQNNFFHHIFLLVPAYLQHRSGDSRQHNLAL